MVINWSVTAVYNTIMSVSTGIGLLLIVRFFSELTKEEIGQLEGWAIGFGIPGFILTLTGLDMIFTWPLSKMGMPFDDIIFGEPSLAFGVLLMATSILLWRKANLYLKQDINMNDTKAVSTTLKKELPYLLKPMSYFASAMGLALIAIGIAGVRYQLFAAPPQEPISGAFAAYPILEAIFISSLYAITGLGSVLFPLVLKTNPNLNLVKIVRYFWTIAGIIFVVFGAMNYFTHIGLILNTMPK